MRTFILPLNECDVETETTLNRLIRPSSAATPNLEVHANRALPESETSLRRCNASQQLLPGKRC
jgi:hypothetical protein